MALPNQGLHDGINEKEYHGDGYSLSSTSAKTLLYDGPRAYRWQKDNPVFKSAFDFGSVVHALVLGVGDIEVVDAAAWTGRAARDERHRIREAGKTPILKKDYRVALNMADAVDANPVASELLFGGRAEVSAWAEDPETGVIMRGRFDYLKDDSFSDVKTAAGKVDPREFSWTVRNFHYTFQAAWYQRLLALNGYGDVPPFWVAVSKDPPHDVYVHRPSQDMLDAAHEDVDRALALYAECKERDEWPGLADSHTIHTLTDTPWTYNYDEQEEVIYG